MPSKTIRMNSFRLRTCTSALMVAAVMIFGVYFMGTLGTQGRNNTILAEESVKGNGTNKIIIVTPTRRKPERLGDLTMLAQVLSKLENVHWIVVEDANETQPLISRLLARSQVPYTYLFASHNYLPCRGWSQRNKALEFLEANSAQFGTDSVVYFGDDDNAYDLRLFDNYVRNVKKVGTWAVGTPGSIIVESPLVENGSVVGWSTRFRPEREFAIDMAGFAVSLRLIIEKRPRFDLHCAGTKPESCFLGQLGIRRRDLEPFESINGHREVLVWHRRTEVRDRLVQFVNGYDVELPAKASVVCSALKEIHDMTYEKAVDIVETMKANGVE